MSHEPSDQPADEHEARIQALIRRVMARVKDSLADPQQSSLAELAANEPEWTTTDIEAALALVARVSESGELEQCLAAAKTGDAGSMRRVAEIMELLGQREEAIDWWKRAATAGDEDAIEMVKFREL